MTEVNKWQQQPKLQHRQQPRTPSNAGWNVAPPSTAPILRTPPARAQARETLGQEVFAAAYESALTSGYESALALAREFLCAA